MKKQSRAARAVASKPLVQRVSGKITSAQYVRGLDQRASERRKDATAHRRSK